MEQPNKEIDLELEDIRMLELAEKISEEEFR